MSGDVRVYRALLRLFPGDFRRRFGAEMLELFDARLRSAAGAGRLVRFWTRTLLDLTLALGREYRRAAATAAWPPWRLASADVRDALRVLRRSPGTTATVVLLMGLGIGAATAVFGLVNAVLLRPLPYRDADRIVMIWETRPDRGVTRSVVGAHEFAAWPERTSSFAGLAAIAFDYPSATLTGGGDPVALVNVRTTSQFFDVMGVEFAAGRGFGPEHDLPGNRGVAVISHALWQTRFGGAPDMVGRTVELGGRAATIIGIAPASFTYPRSPAGRAPDVWRPIAEPLASYRGRHYLFVVGRLASGVTMAQAQQDLSAAAGALSTEFPTFSGGHGVSVVPLRDELVRTSRPVLVFVFGGVVCLVLIGCANVAGLLIAVAIGRRAELGVRLALGATRGRVWRQLLIEGLTLALAGGVAGIALALSLAQLAPTVIPADLLALDRVPIDWRVLGFALGVSLATGVVFGLAPALCLPAGHPADALRTGSRTMTHARPGLRSALVVAQIALTVALASAAGLMLRTWQSLASIDLGFQPEGVLAVDLALPTVRYPEPHRVRTFFTTLDNRLRRIPGVTHVTTVNLVPTAGGRATIPVAVEGRPSSTDELNIQFRVVGVDYFRALGVPVEAGRVFAPSDARLALPLIRWFPQQPMPARSDAPQPPPVAVINRAMARAVWPDDNPIGRRFQALLSPPITVIGVVGNSRGDSLRTPPAPEFYLSDLQEPQGRTNVLIRSTTPAIDLVPIVRREVQAIDRDLPLVSAASFSSVVDAGVGVSRFTSINVAAFALTALLLMGAGLYGLVSYTTSSRAREIGIRLALGASAGEIRRLVGRQTVALGLAGLTLGLAASWPLAGLVREQIFGVTPHDPMTYAGVAAVLAAALVAATWLPARRATQTDPARVLRGE
jgi:putative ABC transport system permease protein